MSARSWGPSVEEALEQMRRAWTEMGGAEPPPVRYRVQSQHLPKLFCQKYERELGRAGNAQGHGEFVWDGGFELVAVRVGTYQDAEKFITLTRELWRDPGRGLEWVQLEPAGRLDEELLQAFLRAWARG